METISALMKKLAALSSKGDIQLPNESGKVDPRLPDTTKSAEAMKQGWKILRDKHLIGGKK